MASRDVNKNKTTFNILQHAVKENSLDFNSA